MNQMPSRLTPFQYGWYATDLGLYRPCDSTYCLYPYDSLPPLPALHMQETLHWLEPLDEDIKNQMHKYSSPLEIRTRLTSIITEAEQLKLSLPASFLQLMASPDLQDRIPSCTDCYFTLPKQIVTCPGSEDSYIIRFLDDSQAVLMWYLYVTPGGEHCILVSHYGFYELAEEPEHIANVSDEERLVALKGTFVCAPSFETFLYRFWLENSIWYKHVWYKGRKPLTEEEQRYLSYYTREKEAQ